MKKHAVALLVLVAVFGSVIAAACSHEGRGQGEAPKETYDIESDAVVAKSRADMALSWASISEWDRVQLCLGLENNGWDQTREGLMSGAPPDRREYTNWDAAVAYIVEQCEKRQQR